MYLNKFKNLKLFDNGRYSDIYKALDIENNRKIAIKKIKKYCFNEPDYDLKCVKREIEITKVCQNPNIIKFYEHFETNDEFVLVFELCDTTLSKYLEEIQYIKEFIFFNNLLLNLIMH